MDFMACKLYLNNVAKERVKCLKKKKKAGLKVKLDDGGIAFSFE